eukprot:TRINITY_DN7859_c0_g1_i2.p1 TRINITY_DN7859_c0_g1~~TRINITY_DN7859_c0_g1_i2.p1  ORF type:complete len:393 (-),score=51.15 TRINITY_DN7859_c0_g1_i2:72-1250(-)
MASTPSCNPPHTDEAGTRKFNPDPAAPSLTPEEAKHILGAPGGKEIDNKRTILSSIDAALGVKKPPAVEFIFVEPWLALGVFKSFGLSINPFGHAAIRYTMPSGEQKVMNIVGVGGSEMVYFMPPEEYFYGTGNVEGSEQRGMYNRNMVSVRIENWPDDKIEDMDYYFRRLQRRYREKRTRYHMSPLVGFLVNFAREYAPLPLHLAERGNCAWWTSKGLAEADLTDWPRAWPKAIWVDLFESLGPLPAPSPLPTADTPLHDPSTSSPSPSQPIHNDNVHVVSYRRIPHAFLSYGKPGWTFSGVTPGYLLHNLAYRNLESFANVIVEVPQGSSTAVVVPQADPKRPSFWRHNRFYIMAGTLAVVSVAASLLTRGRIRPRFRRQKHATPPPNTN